MSYLVVGLINKYLETSPVARCLVCLPLGRMEVLLGIYRVNVKSEQRVKSGLTLVGKEKDGGRHRVRSFVFQES